MKDFIITFIVTKDCQLRCKYCYLVGKNQTERMALETAKKVIDILVSEPIFLRAQTLTLDFIGGEPLIEIDLIDEIVKYAFTIKDSCGCSLSNKLRLRITTNGLLYGTSKVQSFIAQYHDILSISLSIDGTPKKNDTNRVFPNGSGSYSKIIDNIRLWIKQFPNEGTKMTISHDDLPFIKDSILHLISLGIRKIDTNPVLEPIWQHGDAQMYEEQFIQLANILLDMYNFGEYDISMFSTRLEHERTSHDVRYFCGNMFLSIDASGSFYTCLRFAQYSLRNKKARTVGNVNDGINWNLLRPYYAMSEYSISNKECNNCEVASTCKTCIAENYDSSDVPTIYNRSTAICSIHKAEVRIKNYYLNKLNHKINNDRN